MNTTDIKAGETYTATFPRDMGKTDFTKCLKMARRYGRFTAGSWTIKATGFQVVTCIQEMITRGADVTNAEA